MTAIIIFCVISILISLTTVCVMNAIYDTLFEFCNPVEIYYMYDELNYFGVALLTVVFNILAGFGAIAYWLYKIGQVLWIGFKFICTTGRN